MTDLADRALIRVFRQDTPVGVGFLVGDDTMVTCAHVAATAAEVPHPSVGDVVHVDFPMIEPTARIEAKVLHVPVQPDGADIVALRVSSVSSAARAVRVVAAEELRDHQVRAYGVPENRARGVWSQGVVRGPIADGLIHVEDDRGYGLPLLRGFSGSPLIDDRLSAVVGMVISVESKQERRIGYALSGNALYEAWPELADLAAQPSPFRGLEPFGVNDFERFFGRKAQALDLVERLSDTPTAVVTGPSGIGKTSFVLAGVVARLVGEDVAAVVIRPGIGGGPWRSTATKLATLLPPKRQSLNDVDGIVDRLTGGQLEDVVNRVLVSRGASAD